MIDAAAHIAVLLFFPPLLIGAIGKTKAAFAGRTGPSLAQPYFDLVKLFRKGTVVSGTATWVFVAGPAVTLAATVAAGLLIPFGSSAAPLSFTGDFILFAYLFALARFFTTSAALDTGSSFEGMGASREVTFAVLSEPALFFALLALAKTSGSLSLAAMLTGFAGVPLADGIAPFVLVSIGLFIVLLAETCRLPVDDPATHLELTMIHEAMVLDHSGPLLGAVLYGSAVKLLVLASFLLRVLAPYRSGKAWIDWPLFLSEALVLAVALGVLESVTARFRMSRVPYLLTGALLLCGAAFVLIVR